MALASQRKYPCGICLGPLMSSGFVPLAWRNLLANKPRLLRSSDSIGFAVLLMLIQLGFERAFFNASLEIISLLDGDIFIQRASKYRFATKDPFPPSDLEAARAVTGLPALGRFTRTGTIYFGAIQPMVRTFWFGCLPLIPIGQSCHCLSLKEV